MGSAPPRVVRQDPPVYPEALVASGIRGEVLVGFIVDRNGDVADPYVITSSNSAFDRPAVAAVLRWRFEPGRVKGRSVNTRMQVPVIFDVEGGGGRDAFTVAPPGRRGQEGLPEAWRYDTAPNPRGGVTPVFPYRLLREGQKGKATVNFVVNSTGDVVQTKVAAASHPEFGFALLAAIERFRFDPALKNGRPVTAALQMEQIFDPSRVDQRLGLTRDDRLLLKREMTKPKTIMALNQLDTLLKPIARSSPNFPLALLDTVDHGTATIECLVDEQGHVRLPRVIEASDPSFGYAAAQAAAEWLFEPPQAGGKPVVVRVQVPFEFRLEPPGAKDTGEPQPKPADRKP